MPNDLKRAVACSICGQPMLYAGQSGHIPERTIVEEDDHREVSHWYVHAKCWQRLLRQNFDTKPRGAGCPIRHRVILSSDAVVLLEEGEQQLHVCSENPYVPGEPEEYICTITQGGTLVMPNSGYAGGYVTDRLKQPHPPIPEKGTTDDVQAKDQEDTSETKAAD